MGLTVGQWTSRRGVAVQTPDGPSYVGPGAPGRVAVAWGSILLPYRGRLGPTFDGGGEGGVYQYRTVLPHSDTTPTPRSHCSFSPGRGNLVGFCVCFTYEILYPTRSMTRSATSPFRRVLSLVNPTLTPKVRRLRLHGSGIPSFSNPRGTVTPPVPLTASLPLLLTL